MTESAPPAQWFQLQLIIGRFDVLQLTTGSGGWVAGAAVGLRVALGVGTGVAVGSGVAPKADLYSVRDYGAKGDGKTDDTAA